MKLDRNLNPDGRGKYALLKLRLQPNGVQLEDFSEFADKLQRAGLLDLGVTPETEFFVIRLKDKYAAPALAAYAGAAMRDDREWAMEVLELATIAANHPQQHKPD